MGRAYTVLDHSNETSRSSSCWCAAALMRFPEFGGVFAYNRRVDIIAEFERVIDALTAAAVEYAVCGGFAVNIHGHVRATTDIDLLVPAEHLAGAVAAVKAIGFGFEAGPIPFGVGTPARREIHRISRIDGTAALTLDLMVVAPVFERTWAHRQRVAWRGRELCVVSLAGLAEMKRLAGRPQDLADLDSLGLVGVELDVDD